MQKTDIAPRVRQVIADHYGGEQPIDLPLVLDASRLTEDLGGDDITRIGMACELEVQFGVSVDDDDICGLHTVADVISFVENWHIKHGAGR